MGDISNFVIDPPWPKKKGGIRAVRPHQGRELDYSTMSVGEIFDLLDRDVLSLADTPHNVWLCTIDQFLFEAQNMMVERGYRLHARIIWNKLNGVAPAFSVRYIHEYILWFYKPKFMPVARDMRGKLTTVITEKSREHSRKPEALYEMVESLYPEGERMDVFSRERREGWCQFGDQLTEFGGGGD